VRELPVVLLDPSFRRMQEIFTEDDLHRLTDMAEVVWGRDVPMPPDDAKAALRRVTAVVCGAWRYGDALDTAANLRSIISVSGGWPRDLDYAGCFARGIRVLSAAPAFGPQVAEMALGMALACCREIVDGDAAMRSGSEQWLHRGNIATFQLYGKPVGFIGYGGLGRALRPLLSPFGCHISVYDPWISEGYLRHEGLESASLDRLLQECRFIFVLATPTKENQALLSRARLELIRRDAVLVLISRSHLVDFEALTALLLERRFRAAIDVFPEEPLPIDHPVRRTTGTVLSAHRAGSVSEGLWEIGRMVVDDLEQIMRGLPPLQLQVAQPELIGRF